MKLKFFGHSAFAITNKSYEILIDPYLSENPLTDKELIKGLKPDYILVTHGHGDHLGDTIELAKNNDVLVIAPFELAMYLTNFGVNTHPMHIGGTYEFPFGIVKLTPAQHGSAVIKNNEITYTGNPCGFIIKIDGKVIYHAGDTGLFYDMKLIGEMNNIDYALLPIGDNFTMGIDDAIKAAEFLTPKNVIPMHFNTFDLIKQDAKEFSDRVENSLIMEPNSELKI